MSSSTQSPPQSAPVAQVATHTYGPVWAEMLAKDDKREIIAADGAGRIISLVELKVCDDDVVAGESAVDDSRPADKTIGGRGPSPVLLTSPAPS